MAEANVDIELDREDVILLLVEANRRLLHKPFLSGITRLEKLIYLLEEESGFKEIGQFFPFFAHNFGPFSKEVYEAVDFLEGCDLLEVREKAYTSPYASADEERLSSEVLDDEGTRGEVREREFALTENGAVVATKVRDALARRRADDVEALDGIVLRYGAWPLRQLIRYVYRQYPEMTVNSIHPEANR